MQFIKNGPDVPNRLLQAHEDGRVVFFCGAGISGPAGLPNFEGLVKQLYADLLTTTPSPVQQVELGAKRFDAAAGLLEGDVVGGRETVRRKLAEIFLKPKAPNATGTHEALLTLGISCDGRTRLVTTNFDRLFEEAIAAKSLNVERFKAPLLPIPKQHWNGLVYLHGLLSEVPTPDELNRLVISSGDFGLAYLSERWASRFVSELFRNYTVCFVGYSIDDPIMRYMTDALAADHLLGESPLEMFAFGSYSKGKEEKCADEWKAKNVTPILYRKHRRHAYLHGTLRAWAETCRDRVTGKERIVSEYARARPLKSTKEDDFVGRMLWALSDPIGEPAKHFADLNPVPSLEWLKPISEKRYGHGDLDRFGVPTKSNRDKAESNRDEALKFSLIERPSPYHLAPRMAVVDEGARRSHWDKVTPHLARWMARHLNDPNLLLWLIKHGGQLHKTLAQVIEYRLTELSKLERDESDEKKTELADICDNAPNAVPGPLMRTLWRLLLTGRVKSRLSDFNAHLWGGRFKRDRFKPTLRMELRDMLTPRVSLREPYHRLNEDGDSREPNRIEDLVEWEIVLSADNVHYSLEELRGDERWKTALPELLSDFTGLLRDALDLMRELGGADDKHDRSGLHRLSIGKRAQNNDLYNWTVLIDLTRDAWLVMADQSPEQARLSAETWWHVPYPLFRRLAFFAATQPGVIPHRRALDWLLADGNWWLWSKETKREARDLLVALTPQLDDTMSTKVEHAILDGPPRDMLNDDIAPNDRTLFKDHETWLRLTNIKEARGSLTSAGMARWEELSAQYPNWKLVDEQGPGQAGTIEYGREFVATPRRRRELVEWLRRPPSLNPWQQDDWRKRCRAHFPTIVCALYVLASEDVWPIDYWRQALSAWSEEKFVKRSWRRLGPVLAEVPEELLQAIVRDAGYWLETIAKTSDHHKEHFFTLVHRILELDHPDGIDSDDPVTCVINHPVGRVTEVLLLWWFRQSLKDGQGLPEQLASIFTRLCDPRTDKFRHGRPVLASHVITLFRVDEHWTKEHLLPFFDWKRSEAEARSVWAGFLWSARLYHPLLAELKTAFLETASHYDELGEWSREYAWILTSAALDPRDTFTHDELARATDKLPQKGLIVAACMLTEALKSAGDRRADYWRNRVDPYLRRIWPQTLDKRSPNISTGLGWLCIAAESEFPAAFDLLRPWLQELPPFDPDLFVHRLFDAKLGRKFPEKVLAFLDLVIGDQNLLWAFDRLKIILEAIRGAEPSLVDDSRYRKLARRTS